MANTKVIEQKQQLVDQIKEKIDSAKVIVVSDYRGIPVKDITGLRRKLLGDKSEFKIVKNTLLRRALEAAGFTQLNDHLNGPTGVLFGYGDPVAPVKTLVKFIAEVEKGEIKAGLVEKVAVDPKEITALSKLPPREALIAKVVGGFKSPLYGLVNVLNGNLRNLVYALNAIKEKKGEVK
jgi:large subunit ribosomal protein L10